MSQPQTPRKSSRKISNSELFYVTRSLFRRNKQLVDKINSSNIDYLSPNTDEVKKMNRTPQKYGSMSERQTASHTRSSNSTFSRFFNTSAHRASVQCQDGFAKSRFRFLYSRENGMGGASPLFETDQSQAWQKVHERSPSHDFSKSTQRKVIKNPTDERDSELRFNNFELLRVDINHTPSLGKISGRQFKHLNLNMLDRVYDRAYEFQSKKCFDEKPMQCLFDHNRENLDSERKFYQKQREQDQPKTVLDDQQVLHGFQMCFYNHKPPSANFENLTDRTRPPSSPIRLVKDNENFYLTRKQVPYLCSRKKKRDQMLQNQFLQMSARSSINLIPEMVNLQQGGFNAHNNSSSVGKGFNLQLKNVNVDNP